MLLVKYGGKGGGVGFVRKDLENGRHNVDEDNGDEVDNQERVLPLVRVHDGEDHDDGEHQDACKLNETETPLNGLILS